MSELVVDIDKIKNNNNNNNLNENLNKLESSSKSLYSLDISYSISDISKALEPYITNARKSIKSTIKETNSFTEKVDECCRKYKKNEDDVKVIDTVELAKIIGSNMDLTINYKGTAIDKLHIDTDLTKVIYFDPNLTYNDGGMPIPIYYQQDYGYVALGKSNISSSGCGFASCAMVASYLTKTKITPEDIAKWGQGYYVSGAGMSWELPKATAEHYNLGKVKQTNSIDEVYKSLKNGKPVVCSQGPGIFTGGGHIITLRGLDDNGKILVNDPNQYNSKGKGYNSKGFNKSEIDASASTY